MVDRGPTSETQAKGGKHMKDGHYFNDGDEVWVQDGVFHREEGPAIIQPTGWEFWYKNGFKHREDGPAAIVRNIFSGEVIANRYWLDGIPYLNIKNDVLWRIEVQRLKRKKEDNI